MAQHFAGGVAREDGMGFRLLQNCSGRICEDQLQKIFQAYSIVYLRAEK